MLTSEKMDEYAELGAKARLFEIQAEMAHLMDFMREMDRMELPPVPETIRRRVPKKKKRGRPRASVLVTSPSRAARPRTAEFLHWVEKQGVATNEDIRGSRFTGIPVGVLLKNGYLEATGNGYGRTTKPFKV